MWSAVTQRAHGWLSRTTRPSTKASASASSPRLGRRWGVADRHETRAATHADDCWSWGPGHYDCDVREIERLRGALEECHARSVTRWRRLLAAESEIDRLRAERESLWVELENWKECFCQ